MSDQKQGSGTTTLEELLLSRTFGRLQRAAANGPEEAAGVGEMEVVFTDGFGGPYLFAPALHGGSDDAADDPPLEAVLRSVQFGTSLTLVPSLEPAREVALVASGAEPVVVPFPTQLQRDNRYRAIAAVSGIAAAALVVAGVTSGTGQPRSSDIAALGQHSTAQPRVGPGSLSDRGSTGIAAPGPTAPQAAFASTNGTVPQSATSRSDAAPSSGRAVSGSPGTTATAVPSPGAPAGGPTGSGGTGGGTGSPAPAPPAGGSPVAPVVTALGSSVSGVGASVTSIAGQLGSSMPPTATVTGAVGAAGTTVSGFGQTLSSTTA